jgi:t-SNARE complex subunit (syntaxin)
MKKSSKVLNSLFNHYSKAMVLILCVSLICATGISVAAINMEKSPFKASASQKGSHEAVTEAQTVLVSEVGDISLLTQVNRAAEAVEAYKKRKAEYEEYLESIRKTYTYAAPDITEEEIVTMLESDEEPQIMSTDVMQITEENEETVPEEHVNDEVVEEEGEELTETASLS